MKQVRTCVCTKINTYGGREQSLRIPMYPYPEILQPIKRHYLLTDICYKRLDTVARFPLTGNSYTDGWLGALI